MKPAKQALRQPKDFYRFEVQSGSYYHVAWCATWEDAEKVVHAEIEKDVRQGRLPQNIKYHIFERGATYTIPGTERISVKRLDEGASTGEVYELPRS